MPELTCTIVVVTTQDLRRTIKDCCRWTWGRGFFHPLIIQLGLIRPCNKIIQCNQYMCHIVIDVGTCVILLLMLVHVCMDSLLSQ